MNTPVETGRISWRESLATRISLITILLVVLAILIVGFFLIWIAYETEQQSALQLQKKNADTIAILISGYIGSVQDQIQVFAESIDLNSLSPEDQKYALMDFLIRHKSTFSQFTVINMQGTEITKVSRFHTFLPEELLSNLSDPVFLQAKEGNTYISPIFVAPDSGLLSMQIGVPLKNLKGEPVGVFIAVVNCVQLWQEVSGQDVGSIGYAYIVDKAGRFIAFQDISEVLNRYDEDMSAVPPVADFILHSSEVSEVYQYRGLSGEPVVGTYSPVNGTDWAVIAELPENEAFAGVRQMLWYYIILLLCCIVIAGGVGFFMSRRLTIPIDDLTITARKLGSGEWETEIYHQDRPDEVGVLSRSFGRMRDELKNLYSNLERQMTELSQVQEDLRLSEEQYRTIFENNGNALLVVEEDMTIFLINHKLEELWGVTKDEMEGKEKWTSFIAYQDDKERMVKYHQQRRLSDPAIPSSYEFSFLSKNGDIKVVTTYVSIIPGTNRSLAAIIDITEKKQVEKELNQARKKLSLLNTITFNDIRSNVYVLAGYIDLIRESTSDPDLLPWIDQERQNIKNINDALVFAKDYQDMGLKPACWQNVYQVFLYAISHLDLSSVRRNMNLSGLEIYADPLLEKVFFTLASNVIIHGGDVTTLSVYYTQTPDEVIIVFEDDGTGIPDSRKESIFYQLSEEKKGISLFFAREILGITNIQIRETGYAGRGARFEVIIPRGKFRIQDPS